MKALGATVAVTGWAGRGRAWAAHHRRVFYDTLRELVANPLASLMTWFVLGIALALPTLLYVVLQNVSMVGGDWGGRPRVSLYLVDGAQIEEARELAAGIAARQDISLTHFISSDDALQEFQQRSGFGEILATLGRNPLPHVIEITPISEDAHTLSGLVDSWEDHALVERASVDFQWIERLFALLAFAERLVTALAVVLGLGVILVMGNTIRLAIENRRQEIQVVKLVGGTNAFVRRPFLYLGFWYGLGGAIIAFMLVWLSLAFLAGPVETLARSYPGDDFVLAGLGFGGNLLLLCMGALLGVLGALLAVSRHLKHIEP